MLVLGRRDGQSLILTRGDDRIVVKVCDVGTRQAGVRIGIEAPDEWNIVREELLTDPQPRPAGVTK
mgnify:CR=1 FL=1